MLVQIPLNSIEKISIYINRSKKTLSQIKQETKADYIINGGLYQGTQAVCHLKADNYVYAEDEYTYWGYGWNTNDISMRVIPDSSCANYISCVEMIKDKKKKESMTYNLDVGGARPRSAMGLRDGNLMLYCSQEKNTPESLQEFFYQDGFDSAIMLDGGGSTQCDFLGEKITSSRKVHNLILVYLKQNRVQKEETLMSTNQSPLICLDAGHDSSNINASPDGTYKEYEFAYDMSLRIQNLLVNNGLQVMLTRTDKTAPTLTQRATMANNAKADIFVSLHSNASNTKGWTTARGIEVFTASASETAKRNILAQDIIEEFEKANLIMRSPALKHDRFTVLTKTSMPACLIEFGFHNNKEDVELLKSETYRNTLAVCVAKGICEYYGKEYITPALSTNQEQAASWAQKAWNKAYTNAIMDGSRPNDNVTRQELAVVLDRLGLLR